MRGGHGAPRTFCCYHHCPASERLRNGEAQSQGKKNGKQWPSGRGRMWGAKTGREPPPARRPLARAGPRVGAPARSPPPGASRVGGGVKRKKDWDLRRRQAVGGSPSTGAFSQRPPPRPLARAPAGESEEKSGAPDRLLSPPSEIALRYGRNRNAGKRSA